jgi:hypothetical protein
MINVSAPEVAFKALSVFPYSQMISNRAYNQESANFHLMLTTSLYTVEISSFAF